jgi:predicted nicotinamide N-methyase
VLDLAAARRFVLEGTRVTTTPLLPELPLHLATEVTPLWHATEAHLAAAGVAPPFWAFAWSGGQALARHVLDHPELVRGASVLDLASGSGLCALAAARAGAIAVTAVDLDPLAEVAIALNVDIQTPKMIAPRVIVGDATALDPAAHDVVLAGDVCYDAAMTAALWPWLSAAAAAGKRVLVGDPGRAYLPRDGYRTLATIEVETIDDVEGERRRSVRVLEVLARR